MAKTLPPKLKKVLDTSVKTINWVKGLALNHRIFKSFYEELESEQTVMLFHTEVCWLLRGQALTLFFEMRKEIKVFLKKHDCDLLRELESQYFMQMLAYLDDIFTHLNDLSVSL